MSALAPLHCDHCAAPIPLVDASAQICPFCQHTLVTPPAYIEAVSLRRETVAARRAAEPQWQRLAAGSSPWWQIIGGAMMTLGPPILTAVGLSAEPARSTAAVFALFTLPSLLPGGVVSVWGATADISRAGVERSLAARPASRAGAPPHCRECGAPLAVAKGELSCTCLYCGTDSLIRDIPLRALAAERSHAITSLSDAASAIRRRMWMVRLAILGITTVLFGIAFALYIAQQRLQ